MSVIERLTGREILDSRGNPTVLATCRLAGRKSCSASVPAGASTGEAEAHELRDGDMRRYHGRGCRKAVGQVNEEIDRALASHDFSDQAALDRALITLDGTPDKSRLGANAILAVSMAFARAAAEAEDIPLWRYFSRMAGVTAEVFPRLTINLFSGGRHAGGQVAIQDVLAIPAGARSIDESLSTMYDVYQAAAELSFERYGMRLLRADEGGLAPPFDSSEEMIRGAVEAVERAGYKPGKNFALAVDVAASEFFSDGGYRLDGETLDSDAMIERVASWVERYPIVSVEDGLSQDDWAHWPKLKRAIGDKALVVGDDLLCTNPVRIRRAIESDAANALLLKVNQVGTLTEAAEAHGLARSAGWAVTVSVRSGETEDDWAADLAVGWRADQFKNGSITQSERLAKYNRLLEIEGSSKWPMSKWPYGL